MKAARLLVLAVALLAGGGAAYMMMGGKEPPPPPVQVIAPPPVQTDGVLVASRDLPTGTVLADGDMRWDTWPKAQVPSGAILRSQDANAPQSLTGMFVRNDMLAGDQVRRERLSKEAGAMAGTLASGTRAVAIDLADQGKSNAGGFILPNDRVDVIRTFHPEDAPNTYASETILTNVRILAIGQTVQGKAGDRTVIAATATLELTPEEAERVILGQRTGQLTLSLVNTADAARPGQMAQQPQTVTVVRYGNSSLMKVH